MWMARQLQELHQKFSTPALLIAAGRLEKNIFSMQRRASESGKYLRPHIKTHKCPEIAKRQIAQSAGGITVAKSSEAQVFAAAGFTDIFIASQVTQPLRVATLRELAAKIRLLCAVDHPDQLALYEKVAQPGQKLSLRVEIDCGFGRCGLLPDNPRLPELAREIDTSSSFELEGLFTHGGQAYSAGSAGERERAAQAEAEALLEARNRLKAIGIEVATLSVGSTPTAEFAFKQQGITEVRPGNYVFYDGIQNALGVCEKEQVSLFVLATVMSLPAAGRVVCDAGSKALSSDRGAHAAHILPGFGQLACGRGYLERLSEEHGIIRWDEKEPLPKIGEPLLIIPNHACVASNLYDTFYLIEEGGSVQSLPIAARGKSQ